MKLDYSEVGSILLGGCVYEFWRLGLGILVCDKTMQLWSQGVGGKGFRAKKGPNIFTMATAHTRFSHTCSMKWALWCFGLLTNKISFRFCVYWPHAVWILQLRCLCLLWVSILHIPRNSRFIESALETIWWWSGTFWLKLCCTVQKISMQTWCCCVLNRTFCIWEWLQKQATFNMSIYPPWQRHLPLLSGCCCHTGDNLS